MSRLQDREEHPLSDTVTLSAAGSRALRVACENRCQLPSNAPPKLVVGAHPLGDALLERLAAYAAE